jgi:hypothetical protein
MRSTALKHVDRHHSAPGHAGEVIEDSRSVLGLALYALAILGLGVSLYMLGVGDLSDATMSIAVTVTVGAAAWLSILGAHRRLVRLDRQWLLEHPKAHP